MRALLFSKGFRRLAVVFAFVLLLSCAPMQNLSVNDVRTQNRLVREGRIDMPLEKAAYCLRKTLYNSGQGVNIEINPDDKNLGTIFIYGMGLTQSNPYIIIDIVDRGDFSVYKGYSAMPTWNSMIDSYIQKINHCGQCG